MLKNLLIVVTLNIVLVLTSGCVTMKHSRIPEFLQELSSHEFSPEEKETIGDILDYINQLENE